MFDVESKIQKLKEITPDPREGQIGKWLFTRKKNQAHFPMILGTVTDNKDPDCLGRVRVSMDMIVPGAQTPFIPIAGQWKKKESGWWVLPEIGTQALVLFTASDFSKGYVMGFIYDRKHLPPEHSTENCCDSILWQSKKHRLEIIDEDGKEEIRMESAEGKMRIVLNKEGGIQIENELGDINIKCRNFKTEGEDEIHLKSKKISIQTEECVKVKTQGKLELNSDKKVILKGKNIKMTGSKGVTAEKKQLAVEGDKVIGFDTHIMVVPAGTSTANVPLPHPFIGQMKDGLSNNVRIGNKQCATKDSVAKHNDSNHMQLPGTIKFQKNPSKDGKVTGGTIKSVKINGKETAVIGSTVTTCNDVGAQNNSTIVSIGASIPMPSIINPLNNDEYKKERDKDKKEPGFETVKWASASVNENEEVELSASVKDIEDDNMVTLQVFPEGKGPE
ncbi:MAG: phage baseplate assembly protein V, partial [Treponema sp.]|nr:phage baseplate assembly protein V [Treponema sp.]